jgi:hypothetical protein
MSMARTKYKFSHRSGRRYYWTRRAPEFGPAYEEQISCSVLWFWGWVTDDSSLPKCNCEKGGHWGATAMMPDNNHVLVSRPEIQYLAHREEMRT